MISLRPYIESDLHALFALDQLCFDPQIAYTRQELEYFTHRNTATTVVAEAAENGDLAGFLILDFERPHSGHIITIDVAQAFRKQGIGATLMREAERLTRDTKRRAMLLEVAVENHPARSFYEKHGYLALRRLSDYYKRGGDALLLGKNL
ncbi:MAG: N-acetyltransferase [Acidobacteriaceae bacterium]